MTFRRLKELYRFRLVGFGIVVMITVLGASSFAALWSWQKWGTIYHEPFDGVFGAVAGALIGSFVTSALVLIGVWQVIKIANTASADFVLRKTEQFFRDETRLLLHLIDSDYLIFKRNSNFNESYFLVDEARIKQSDLHDLLKTDLLKRLAFSAYEIDDLLLGPLEDLGYLESVGTIDFKLIDNTFGFYLEKIMDNPAVSDYVIAHKQAYSEQSWEHVKRLYETVKEQAKPS